VTHCVTDRGRLERDGKLFGARPCVCHAPIVAARRSDGIRVNYGTAHANP
jgi:hypothetical protein